MANSERGARSKAVKDYLKTHPKDSPNRVVEALKQEGIVVSSGLVGNIKYRKKKRTGKPAANRGSKSGGGTMSEAIRDYLRTHRGAKPKEIQQGLAKQGLKVGTGLISNVKHNFQQKGGSLKVRAAARRTRPALLTVDQLLEVKRFAASLGGTDQLRRALDTLEQFR
jgi:hypothetical protein